MKQEKQQPTTEKLQQVVEKNSDKFFVIEKQPTNEQTVTPQAKTTAKKSVSVPAQKKATSVVEKVVPTEKTVEKTNN
ncbi:MAG: hypothetical protein RSB61_03380, partial [Clostridia bacterium]